MKQIMIAILALWFGGCALQMPIAVNRRDDPISGVEATGLSDYAAGRFDGLSVAFASGPALAQTNVESIQIVQSWKRDIQLEQQRIIMAQASGVGGLRALLANIPFMGWLK